MEGFGPWLQKTFRRSRRGEAIRPVESGIGDGSFGGWEPGLGAIMCFPSDSPLCKENPQPEAELLRLGKKLKVKESG